MGLLANGIRAVLAELARHADAQNQINEFVRAYNNDRSLYRSRNRRPRTDLMVKGFAHGFFNDGGLVAKAAKDAFPQPFDEIAFERYIDLALLSGNWWTGERRYELVAEVENDWGELLGTLRDLLNFQAHYKWAVFYQRDPAAETAALVEAVRKVRDLFNKDGFVESADTSYEILVLPDSLSPTGLIGARAIEMCFRADCPIDNAMAMSVEI